MPPASSSPSATQSQPRHAFTKLGWRNRVLILRGLLKAVLLSINGLSRVGRLSESPRRIGALLKSIAVLFGLSAVSGTKSSLASTKLYLKRNAACRRCPLWNKKAKTCGTAGEMVDIGGKM